MPAESTITFRVRYEETDRMESVYHAKYFVYFEMGRTELLRALAIRYSEMEAEGLGLVVIEAQANFRGPAYYDDLITVRTTIPSCNRAMLRPCRLSIKTTRKRFNACDIGDFGPSPFLCLVEAAQRVGAVLCGHAHHG